MYKSLIAGAAGLALALPVAPALASDSGNEAESKGKCTGTSEWKLKAETKRSGVKVEFEVDSRVVGQSWDYVLTGPSGELAAGTALTDDEGEFEVKVLTSGAVTDAFSAIATSADESCDSAVGVVVEDDDDDDAYDDDDSEDGVDDDSDDYADDDDARESDDEGTCTAGSAIVLSTKKAGNKRIATLAVKSAKKGQKWRYQIKRGNKVVEQGAAKSKGKKAAFKVKVKTKGKGVLTADAYRVDGSEDCTTDDD